jgi:hypothetical protein
MNLQIEILRDAITTDVFDIVGYIPDFLNETDSRTAREQFNDNYRHGGGWKPFTKFTLDNHNRILYPGDPPLNPWAKITLRDETILVYEGSWVCVIQKDGTYEVARMD